VRRREGREGMCAFAESVCGVQIGEKEHTDMCSTNTLHTYAEGSRLKRRKKERMQSRYRWRM
jgi:hypothetical protein